MNMRFINDTAKVGDLVVPEGLELLDDPEQVLCSVLPPRKVEEEAEEGAAEAAEGAPEVEPEIVGKGDKEEAAG